jgi:hypothetical protein
MRSSLHLQGDLLPLIQDSDTVEEQEWEGIESDEDDKAGQAASVGTCIEGGMVLEPQAGSQGGGCIALAIRVCT